MSSPTRVTSKRAICPTCKTRFRRYWLKSASGRITNAIKLCPTCRKEWTLKRIYLDLENLAQLENIISAWDREEDILAKVANILKGK